MINIELLRDTLLVSAQELLQKNPGTAGFFGGSGLTEKERRMAQNVIALLSNKSISDDPIRVLIVISVFFSKSLGFINKLQTTSLGAICAKSEIGFAPKTIFGDLQVPPKSDRFTRSQFCDVLSEEIKQRSGASIGLMHQSKLTRYYTHGDSDDLILHMLFQHENNVPRYVIEHYFRTINVGASVVRAVENADCRIL